MKHHVDDKIHSKCGCHVYFNWQTFRSHWPNSADHREWPIVVENVRYLHINIGQFLHQDRLYLNVRNWSAWRIGVSANVRVWVLSLLTNFKTMWMCLSMNLKIAICNYIYTHPHISVTCIWRDRQTDRQTDRLGSCGPLQHTFGVRRLSGIKRTPTNAAAAMSKFKLNVLYDSGKWKSVNIFQWISIRCVILDFREMQHLCFDGI